MVDHVRDQLLARLKLTLTGLLPTGSNVFLDRTDALDEDERPGLTINQGNETCEYMTMGYPRTVIARFDVDIDAYDDRSVAQADARKRANTIAAAVQAAIGADVDLDGLAQEVRLMQTDFDLDTEGDRPAAVAMMKYQVTYHFKETTPTVAA